MGKVRGAVAQRGECYAEDCFAAWSWEEADAGCAGVVRDVFVSVRLYQALVHELVDEFVYLQ